MKRGIVELLFGDGAKGRFTDFGKAAKAADAALSKEKMFEPFNEKDGLPTSSSGTNSNSDLPEDYSPGEAGNTVLKAIEAGAPFIFMTGRAGTGKSTFVRFLQRRYQEGRLNTAIVAPTGVAALNAGGQTIHSFFKFPPRRIIPAEDIHKKDVTIIKKLDLLIIDEISMVRADLLDAIDYALRLWRGSKAPFGGVQLLVVGDLLQLPPIVKGDERTRFETEYRSPWFFDAQVFMKEVEVLTVELTEVHRQTDGGFIDLLNRIRVNEDHREAVAELNRDCFRDAAPMSTSLTLTATNSAADSINDGELEAIAADIVSYEGTTIGNFKLTGDRLPSPNPLMLKIGARVMVTQNIPGAVNGSLATVLRLEKDAVTIELDVGGELRLIRACWQQFEFVWSAEKGRIVPEVVGEYRQIPLMLGWAVTIHKSQGLTLDSVTVDLGRGAFAVGQTYVALSRCRDKGSLRLARPISMRDVMADTRVIEFQRSIMQEPPQDVGAPSISVPSD